MLVDDDDDDDGDDDDSLFPFLRFIVEIVAQNHVPICIVYLSQRDFFRIF